MVADELTSVQYVFFTEEAEQLQEAKGSGGGRRVLGQASIVEVFGMLQASRFTWRVLFARAPQGVNKLD